MSSLSNYLLKRFYSNSKHPYQVFESIIAAHLAKRDLIILDAGCGRSAPVLAKFVGSGSRLIGIDAVRFEALPVGIEVINANLARIPLADRSVDLIISRSVFEHLTQPQAVYAELSRVLRPGGLFLNHCITSLEEAIPATFGVRNARLFWRQGEFIDRYVFPDGELATLSQLTAAAEATGLETRDVENLREHYARTLRHWIARLEQRSEEARMIAGETVYRTWRLYMAASEAAFEAGNIAVVQCLYAKAAVARASGIPQTRDHIYRQR